MVRVKDMTLLLFLIVVCGVNGKSSGVKKYTANMVLDKCRTDKPNKSEQLFKKCKEKTPAILKNKTALRILNREEKETISDIIRMDFTESSEDQCVNGLVMAVVTLNTTDRHVPLNTSSLFNETQTVQIWIPTEPFQNLSGIHLRLGIVIYDSDEQFNLNLTHAIITSKVMRVEVPGRDIVNLTDPLVIHIPVSNKTTRNSRYSCQFYDEKEDYSWKNDGCLTTQISDYVVKCTCDHMTAFAVLLVEFSSTDEQHWKMMSYISYVGCGLSAVFSACSILSYVINSKARKDVSISIHVSLSAALFLLNITFLLSEWTATLSMNGVCVFVAVTIHYSLLCCFTWMAIEAIHLYLLLVRVFNIYIKHYMLKLSVIGWGVPALLIGVLLTVHNSHSLYGTKAISLSDANKTSAICWLTDPLIIYGVNIVCFTLVFVFNLGVLITVLKQIFKLRKVDHGHQKIPACKDVGTVLGLMCLLGTTWGLAFFSSGYTNYPILYLFCIFNSMQGFYIFLWMCLTARRNKQRVDRISTVTSTLTVKES